MAAVAAAKGRVRRRHTHRRRRVSARANLHLLVRRAEQRHDRRDRARFAHLECVAIVELRARVVRRDCGVARCGRVGMPWQGAGVSGSAKPRALASSAANAALTPGVLSPPESSLASSVTTPARTHALRNVTGWKGCEIVVSTAICATCAAAVAFARGEPCLSMARASVSESVSAFCARASCSAAAASCCASSCSDVARAHANASTTSPRRVDAPDMQRALRDLLRFTLGT